MTTQLDQPLWERNARIQITCPKGLAELLAEEVTRLGYEVIEVHTAAVELRGTLEDCMRINLWVRTGHRVLFELADAPCDTPGQLYTIAQDIDWENILPSDGYFTITSSVRNDLVQDTRFPNLKLKDAIVDRIRQHKGERPDTGPSRDYAVVFLYWQENEASIYLDTTGEPLSHRGYRTVSTEAPMRETLAAACVLTTGYTGEGAFVNPMCGSGTIAIEAALIAMNIPPANLRNNLAFMHFKGYPKEKWTQLLEDAAAQRRTSPCGPILASDVLPDAVEAAIQNAQTARVHEWIDITESDFSEVSLPPAPGHLIYNPPYGERQGDVQELVPLYKSIGDFMKQKAPGYTGWVFTGNIRLLKQVGLRANEKRTLYNARLECRLADFDLYA